MLRTILSILAALIGISVIFIYCSYRRDITAARALSSTGSQLIQTSCGPIEYADVGAGFPVISIHGAGGGFDAGLQLADPLTARGFRVIAMSRFGYLRTPMPADGSPMAQADAHACLLNALKIERAGVIAASAGSTSAMQLCLRHPEKCSALVLISPQAYAPSVAGGPPQGPPKFLMPLLKASLHSDFLFWAITRMPHKVVLQTFLGTPPADFENLSARDQANALSLIKKILPITPRSAGMWNDSVTNGAAPRYDLEHLQAPALLIAAQDDLYKTYLYAQYTSERAPNARYISYPTGGHILLGHPEAFEESANFLRQQTKTAREFAHAGATD
jgi:pimeloyl-ACP methyl ester carboxylesterase